ncbi:hypothetical protein EIP91_000969 [Steccherinum ochraceum]|uniref:GYF domain-containing protein n=1 Tax=Steccherinum ochraceum TaxID=92696 RepID=A0A4R0RSK4_9APHY|nr:hypothetical protein EIP91_000969 [Steccherinum ochraceum]
MHFGPEWMRTKQAPARTAPSPPLATPSATTSTASSYSALVAPSSQPAPEKHDLSRPFRFSKEDLLRIYKEGGGRGGLGLEVERWEGIVREVGSDPVGLKDMTEGEKKIFAGPLNSEVRRRQSMDYLSPLATERPKLGHLNSGGPASPMRERMGNFVGRRRDSTDQPPLTLPRKQSLSSLQPALQSPRDAPLPSPRMRIGASGFDGGVLDGSWTSKRRAAEAAAKAGEKTDREAEKLSTDEKILEEEEATIHGRNLDSSSSIHATGDTGSQIAPVNGSGGGRVGDDTTPNHSTATVTAASAATPPGPPPGIDLATIEWSYLDPQGQVQGPFPASTMQKWFDEGYFTPDLLMKRTHLENDWTAVRVLQQLAVSTPIFLTPLAPRQPEPQPPVDYATLNGNSVSYEQELPRNLATSALNARLHDGSNPSDSPMSSYSNPHFSNHSPDPSVFGGRAVNSAFGDLPNSYSSLRSLDTHRQSPAQEVRAPAQAPIGRNGFADGYSNANGYVAGNGVESYSPAADIHMGGGMNGYQHPSDLAGMGNNLLGGYNMTSSEASAHIAGLRLDPRDLQPRYGGYGASPGSPFAQQSFSPIAPSPYMGQQDMRTLQQSPFPVRRPSGPAHMLPLQQQGMQQPFIPQSSLPTQASRVQQDALGYRRPGPFDPNYPTAQNTIAQQRTVTPSQASSYGSQPLQNGNVAADHSPWYAAAQGVVPDGWGQEPSHLTVANLGQHNQLQQEQDSTKEQVVAAEPEPVPTASAPKPAAEAQPEATSSLTPAVAPEPTLEPARVPKSRRKSTAPAKLSPSPVISPVVPAKPPTPTPPAAEPKPAWNVDEGGSGNNIMSLREIQEAEAKKAEMRKAADRERAARAAVASPAASPSVEAVQTFTASWGLPTSQAGARAAAASVKEAPGSPSLSTPPTPQTAVWTAAAKPAAVKKTMKEIQEEEEKRKKQVMKEKETMAAAARRGYADTTVKPAAVVTGGAWTTVGSSGKTTPATGTAPVPAAVPAPVPAPVRPTAAAIASSKTVPGASMASAIAAAPVPTRSVSSGTIAQRTAVGIAPTKASSRPEESLAPSTDFLKWLGDALKGLNSAVSLEEIASMLLQFPVDPDPSTVEIISDLIYANSTTLDGRRFAAEFVSRRKASTKSSPAAGPAGKLSIADVVKTQPKPAQNEWGGFKVVNKKKKGGRA